MSKKTDQNTQYEALSQEGKRLHDRVKKEWNIRDGAGFATLMVACQSLDRLRQAQGIIQADGLITHDRFGQAKLNPACQAEKEARGGLLMALRALNLDLESLVEDSDAT